MKSCRTFITSHPLIDEEAEKETMRLSRLHLGLVGLFVVIASASSAGAQEMADERARVLAVVEASLEAISHEDMIAFTDLMIEEAVTLRVAERDGEVRYAVRDRADSRANTLSVDLVERGFNPEVYISGPLAVVWLPYDIYVDGEWSHCGVNVITLVRIGGDWKIASLAWTVEQPPACERHPDGPPPGR